MLNPPYWSYQARQGCGQPSGESMQAREGVVFHSVIEPQPRRGAALHLSSVSVLNKSESVREDCACRYIICAAPVVWSWCRNRCHPSSTRDTYSVASITSTKAVHNPSQEVPRWQRFGHFNTQDFLKFRRSCCSCSKDEKCPLPRIIIQAEEEDQPPKKISRLN